jgi:hypothetical protein
MRWGEKRGAYRILGDFREGGDLGDPGVDGRII